MPGPPAQAACQEHGPSNLVLDSRLVLLRPGLIVVREGCKALGESSGITSHILTRWVEGTVTQQRCGGSRDKSGVFSDTAGRWLGIVASPGSDVGLSLWLMVPCLFLCSSLTLCLGGANFRSAVATSALCWPFLEEAEMAAFLFHL